jgi:serine/threonine protein kinase
MAQTSQPERRTSSMSNLMDSFKGLFVPMTKLDAPKMEPTVVNAFPSHLSVETQRKLASLAYGVLDEDDAMQAASHATIHSSQSDYESQKSEKASEKEDDKKRQSSHGIAFPATPKDIPRIPVALEAVSPQPLPRNATSPLHFGQEPHDGRPIRERYFETPVKIGRGAWGDVALVQRLEDGQLFALKQFRRKPSDSENPLRYLKRCASEFCIGSILNHPNCLRVIEYEFDQEHYTTAAAITEYLAGGDLYHAISSGTLTNQKEIDCLFAQLIRGVSYLHSIGVAHKDLKPENLLWDPAHSLLKIIDFGSAEIFLPPDSNPIMASFSAFPRASPSSTDFPPSGVSLPPPKFALIDGQVVKLSRGVVGSTPYISGEEFVDEWYDPRQADIWACAIIYLAMCTRKFPWQCAVKTDPRYLRYIQSNQLPVLDRIPYQAKKIISRMLHPNPFKRARIANVLDDAWFKSIETCVDERGVGIRRKSMSLRARMHSHVSFHLAQTLKKEKEEKEEKEKQEPFVIEKKEIEKNVKKRPSLGMGLSWLGAGRMRGTSPSPLSPLSPESKEKEEPLKEAERMIPKRASSLSEPAEGTILVEIVSGTPPKMERGRDMDASDDKRDASRESESQRSEGGVAFT